jgi:hypothetical protein
VRRAVQILRDAEVHQERAAAPGLDQDVVGLHVPVHQAVLVGVLQGVEDRLDHGERALRREGAFGPQYLGERASLEERHRVEDEPFALADEMDGDGVGMAQSRDGAGFLLEARERPRAPREVGAENLERQPPLEIGVDDLEDLGEPATADQPDHPVLRPEGAAKACRGGEIEIARLRHRVLTRNERQAAGPAARAMRGSLGEGGMTGRADEQGHRHLRAAIRGRMEE